jgi:DNA-binding protein H-NS
MERLDSCWVNKRGMLRNPKPPMHTDAEQANGRRVGSRSERVQGDRAWTNQPLSLILWRILLTVKKLTPKVALDAMSLEELWSLHEEISRLLSARIRAEKLELEKRLAVLHRGMTSSEKTDADSMPFTKARRKYPRVLPKYRNAQSPSETWSGRGKLPRWLAAAVKSGRGIEEFRIVDVCVSEKGRRT